MRAFHLNWIGFFFAFFIWFAIAPLLSEIRTTLGLSKKEVWTSGIIGVGGTIFMRFLLGPLCDKLGARILFAVVLCLAAIPTACTGLVDSVNGLYVLRLFIGSAGGTFVMCQYWTSRMFTREVVGTANALVGGWGNLGGGVTQLVMGSALFPLFKNHVYDGDAEKAWRMVCVVPAVVTFLIGVLMYLFSDDAPKGNYSELKKHGVMPEVSAAASFRVGAVNINSWLMFIQYGTSFGVELTMHSAAALYFKDEFDLTTEEAAATASIFGWFNLFSRALGGYLSDKCNAYAGMRGRLAIHTFCLVVEGALVLVFANTHSLGSSIAVMVFFSIVCQAACGTTFGIVPYIDPPSTGAISGIVGAGGNVGAVCFQLGFRNLPTYKDGFTLMGSVILVSTLLSALVFIKGESGLICGEADPVPTKTAQMLAVPEPDAEKADDLNKDEADA
jgi:NNP family nitrate/nitrite transporter-like MFS transporter